MSTAKKLVVCLLALCASGFSQNPVLPQGRTDWNNVTALARATDVRIQLSGSHSLRGRVQNITDDSLVLDSESGSQTVMRLQVARVSIKGKARRGRNTLIGLAIGAGLGGALGGTAASQCSGSICGGHGGAEIAVGIGAGAAVGGIVGALVPAGRWREVYRK